MLKFNFDYLAWFNFINSLVLVACVLICYLVITDDRFTFNRKIFFLILTFGLFCLSFYIEKAPHEIIQDLFWYSLILNGSFIFHVLILDRAFHYCWKNHYEYLGFMISRISFTLSLSGLNYFIDQLKPYLFYLFSDLSITIFNIESEGKNNFFTSYAFFYENYIENNLLLHFTFNLILNILYYSTNFIQIICINFSIIFHNYSLLVLGLQKKDLNFRIIIIYTLQFSILLIISILLGYPRLYIIWIIQALIECYKIFNLEDQLVYRKHEFQKLNFLEKIKYTYHNWGKTIYLLFYYERKYNELEKIYEEPYHPFFMFDLCKFNFYIQAETKYSKTWGSNSWGDLDDNELIPIKSIYKFINWEDMAKGYINNANIYWQENCEYDEPRDKILRIAEALYWTKLINKNSNYLDVLLPNIIISDEEMKLAKELLRKYYE